MANLSSTIFHPVSFGFSRKRSPSKMTSSKHVSFTFLWLLLVIMTLTHMAEGCDYPSSLVMSREDPPWYSHVMDDGSREFEYYIRRSVMEIHFPRGNRHHTRWKCVMALQDKLLLKRQDRRGNSFYSCARFHIRSHNIVQISWSNESKSFDIAHCDEDLLNLDPWPLVRYDGLESDFSQCPFSGGYDLKVTDSQKGENGCNFMHSPMRMESECVGGDGIVFDFISNNCLPDIKMFPKQPTLCVASWSHDGNHYSILRKHEDTRLWCLVTPMNRGTTVKGFLFSDLICHSGDNSREVVAHDISSLKYFILNLHQRNFPSLCEDEYSECSSVECNDYSKQECKKSCKACNETSVVKSCAFPKQFTGPWFLKSPNDFQHVEMKDRALIIQGVGRFQCAAFPDSPPGKSRIYSTVSVYDNGCRPRYTCVKLQHLAPSVMRYSLSQSYVWPAVKDNFGQTICNPDQFYADPSPIEDKYRSHTDSGKPVIAQVSNPVAVNCNLSHVHTLTASLPEGFVCSGTMFTHCEDPTKLRLNFASCSGLIATTTDYRCLANYEGRYWERILLVQNMQDELDAMCFVFNQLKPNEAYVMVAGECDQNAFNFATAGVRKPLLSLKFREDAESCISVPSTIPPPSTTKEEWNDGLLSPHNSKPQASGHSSSAHGNRTHADQGHQQPRRPMSIVTLSPSVSGKGNSQREGGSVGDGRSQSNTLYNAGSSQNSHSGSEASLWTAQHGLPVLLVCVCCALLRGLR